VRGVTRCKCPVCGVATEPFYGSEERLCDKQACERTMIQWDEEQEREERFRAGVAELYDAD
jgi:hypothetical protein